MKANNKLYSVALASTILILVLFFVSFTSSASSPTITETQITTSGATWIPSIYEDRIVWESGDSKNSAIYMYNASTQKKTRVATSKMGSVSDVFIDVAISGDRIVWNDYRNGNYDIYVYDLSTKKDTQISRNETLDAFPSIYGNRIAWMDYEGGIYMYDLCTSKETRISTNKSLAAYNPDIYKDRIVWVDLRNESDLKSDVYLYNISTQKETQITTGGSVFYNSPAIYGDKIVWADLRNNVIDWRSTGDWNNIKSDIYIYDLSTFRETRITTSGVALNPDIYDDRIVWADNRSGNGSDIYMYDLSTSRETRITTSESASFPSIYADRIVWLDDRNGNSNVYMATLSSNSFNESVSNISNSGENKSSKVCSVPGFELLGSVTCVYAGLRFRKKIM